ncbi:3-oxo-5-alpha-steroid 4-dehydrogenase [Musa troglodytarum]|uniref:3-oxo-5-alpha-steroid 4-dehydrogenase n=1 Tax=Musa troglodytarum TaxID=320322 RepID=A0A9E7G6B4_9LILI|nr:3-oxo-5-alpha-steroid 4-dehydrogenase [Musa troglodytarum]
MSIWSNIFYPPPPSAFVAAMSVISCASLAHSGLSEVRGRHLQYSKFWNTGRPSDDARRARISSRAGMLLLYTPALASAAASFGVLAGERSLLLGLALLLHFFKRDFEVCTISFLVDCFRSYVLFIHQYSGNMMLDSAIPISLSYFLSTVCMIYAQYLTQGAPEPAVDLKHAGVVLFLVGIVGNFYHHCLLSKLREKGDKRYKIPKGGLFGLVICPHYLFEIIGFIGVSLISQTVYAFSFTAGTVFYLLGRSYATRRWYLSKFRDFPKEIKALIPYIY